MLEHLFGSRTRAKLLRLLLTNPGQSFFVREVCRKLGEHMNSVRRELINLAKLDIVKEVKADRKKYYQANTDFVLYPELQSLLSKAHIMLQRDLLENIRKAGTVKLLVLTGFFTGMPDTLTDMLIVGKVNRRKFRRMLGVFQTHFDQPIRYTIMTSHEFEYRNDLTDRFLYHILENKKIVIVDRFNLDQRKNLPSQSAVDTVKGAVKKK